MKPIVSGSVARQHGVSEVSSPAAYSTTRARGRQLLELLLHS